MSPRRPREAQNGPQEAPSRRAGANLPAETTVTSLELPKATGKHELQTNAGTTRSRKTREIYRGTIGPRKNREIYRGTTRSRKTREIYRGATRPRKTREICRGTTRQTQQPTSRTFCDNCFERFRFPFHLWQVTESGLSARLKLLTFRSAIIGGVQRGTGRDGERFLRFRAGGGPPGGRFLARF